MMITTLGAIKPIRIVILVPTERSHRAGAARYPWGTGRPHDTPKCSCRCSLSSRRFRRALRAIRARPRAPLATPQNMKHNMGCAENTTTANVMTTIPTPTRKCNQPLVAANRYALAMERSANGRRTCKNNYHKNEFILNSAEYGKEWSRANGHERKRTTLPQAIGYTKKWCVATIACDLCF